MFQVIHSIRFTASTAGRHAQIHGLQNLHLEVIHNKIHRLSAVVFPFHLNTGKPFGALGFLSPDEPPELRPFEPLELFLDSFAAAAAACAAEIVAEVPSP